MIKKYDIKELNDLCENGWLVKNAHPTKPLIIWNYSRTTQFGKHWTPTTLACRGLITDTEGNVVAKPLGKFFNDFEHTDGEIPYHLPHEVFIKYDGSVGIVFKYEDEVILASRGSFTSEQAVKGMEIFRREKDGANFIQPGFTYVFEIIFPQNRIVVNYGSNEVLVLLAAFHTLTGKEIEYDELHRMFISAFPSYGTNLWIAYRAALECHIDDYRSTIEGSDEGYIVRFANGFRMKIKGQEYCRLHRILAHVSNKSIWNSLRFEQPLEEILERIPDEYDAWVKKTISDFESSFKAIQYKHEFVVRLFSDVTDKKVHALQVINYCKENSLNWAIVFAMYHGQHKIWKEIIWKSLRPVFEKAGKTVQELKERGE